MEIALINKNSLILGPMGFNIRMINYELEQLDLNDQVTIDSYKNIPIKFSDEETYLLPLEKYIPDHNPLYHNIGNFTWEIIKENDVPIKVLITYPITNKTLDEVKYLHKQKVKPERQRRENQIVTLTINNTQVEVSTDREERAHFVNKLISCSNIPNSTHNYKFRNDIWVVIGSVEIQSILEQIDNVVQQAFDWELSKLEEIDACETIDEVYSVVITEREQLYPMPR